MDFDEAYRQGKLFQANHVLDLIAQGGKPAEIVARVTASLTGFKATREDKVAARAELKAALEVQE